MKTLLVLNWKMNPATKVEAGRLFQSLTKNKLPKDLSFIIAPPLVFLETLANQKKKVTLAAQNISTAKEGAYTGQISAKQAKSVGAGAVMVNHSETRTGINDLEQANLRVNLALAAGLQPIICIGETNRDKEGKYLASLEQDLLVMLNKVTKTQMEKIILAYEPVWAVGVKEADTPEDFHHNALFLRKVISDRFGGAVAKKVTILYGGSVNPKNAAEFIKAGAQGLLIGRTSLKLGEMQKLINSIATL